MSEDRRRRAVALRYDPERDAAPVVIAQGAGYRADLIRELAATHGVMIREDAVLVDALSRLEEQRAIPPALYGAAAQLLAVVHRLHARWGVEGTRPSIPD